MSERLHRSWDATRDRRCAAKASVTAPVPRYTVVEIPIAFQGVTPFRTITDISDSRAPHVAQARHNRSTRRSAAVMPGGKTTSRYRLTPCRLGQISVEPQTCSPSSTRDHH